MPCGRLEFKPLVFPETAQSLSGTAKDAAV
jgi:hypothetical protein